MEHKIRVGTVVAALLSIACLVVAVVGGYMYLSGQESYQVARRANEERREELQRELDSIEDVDVTPTEVEAKVHSAAEAGNKVADFQNLYRTAATSPDGSSLQTIANNLDSYLASDSKDSRTPWFLLEDRKVLYNWKFESTYSFSMDSVSVLWTCRDSDDDTLFAYTTATYDVNEGIFSDVEVHTTLVGANMQQATEAAAETESGPTPTPDVNQILEWIDMMDNGGTPSPSESPNPESTPAPGGSPEPEGESESSEVEEPQSSSTPTTGQSSPNGQRTEASASLEGGA